MSTTRQATTHTTTVTEGHTMKDTTLDTLDRQVFAHEPQHVIDTRGTLEEVPLEQIELVIHNPRTHVDETGLIRLAEMICRWGQVVPCIGRRISDTEVALYAGQRRYLACAKSGQYIQADRDGLLAQSSDDAVNALAGRLAELTPRTTLSIILLDQEPTATTIARIQAQENAREGLTIQDQVNQLRDVWAERASTADEAARKAQVAADLGISVQKVTELLKLLLLDDATLARIRPADQVKSKTDITITIAQKIAAVCASSPQLGRWIASEIEGNERRDDVKKGMAGFLSMRLMDARTSGAATHDLDPNHDAPDAPAPQVTLAQQVPYARPFNGHEALFLREELNEVARYVTDDNRRAITGELQRLLPGDAPERASATTDPAKALTLLGRRVGEHAVCTPQDTQVTAAIGSRVAHAEDVGAGKAKRVWIIEPIYMASYAIEAAVTRLQQTGNTSTAEGFVLGSLDDDDRADMIEQRRQRADKRDRRLAAATRNRDLADGLRAHLANGLAHSETVAAGELLTHLLFDAFSDLITYYAGWTNPAYQQGKGSGAETEPVSRERIAEGEKTRILDIVAHRGTDAAVAELLVCALGGALLDADGVNRSSGKVLGADQAQRLLDRILIGGDTPHRRSLWTMCRRALQPAAIERLEDQFVFGDVRSTANVEQHRSDTSLADLELGEERD